MRERPVGPDPMLYPPHGDVWETLLGLVIGLALAASGLVWLAAQVAALVFGAHQPVHLGLSDMPEVLVQLAEHPGDPRLAFPPEAQAGLPGPVGAYAAVAISLLVPIALVVVLVRVRPLPRSGGGVGDRLAAPRAAASSA